MSIMLVVPNTDWSLILLRDKWYAVNLSAKRLGPFDDWRSALRAALKEQA